jgi:hypothetical protein
MQRLKSDAARSEMHDLKQIVEQVMELNLMDKRRLISVVDARLVFSKILRDRGHTFVSIAKFLKKDHSTVMHYIDKSLYLFKQDTKLFESYMICKDLFLQNREEIIDEIRDKDTHMQLVRITKQLDTLIKEREGILALDKKNKRFKYIIDLLNKRVPEGKEAFLEYKITQLLNE